MDKFQIAEVLREIAVMLDLKGENRFKGLAYSNAARTLEMLQEDLDTLIAEKRLGEVKGIGAALTEKIIELHQRGSLDYYEELKASLPAGLLECLKVPGLGPKKVKLLWDKLGVVSLQDLERVCKDGKVAELDGFGEKTQSKILQGLANLSKYSGQTLYLPAFLAAEPILTALKACSAVKRAEIAGSLRRKKEVIRDLDFLVSTTDPETVMKLFTTLPLVEEITNQGKTKSSVILKGGIQADVRCVTDEEYPYALMYFTGSKEHNIVLRQRAIEQGKKLNEYGLIYVKNEKLIPCKTEKEIYRDLGFDFIEPELREDMGEIAAAEAHQLPQLVTADEIRGTFHCHTRWSDGAHTVEEMARTAIQLGWEYLGIADHSKSSAVANGLNEKRLASQLREIKACNQRFKDEGLKFHIFSGSEVDILADGSLDFSDEILAQLDYTVASIHQGFTNDEKKQTDRILRAISNPYVAMLGHPTGRLLLAREPYKIDLTAVIEEAARNGTIIELNCTPSRMDMDWRWWKGAAERGVMTSINPDAHSTDELGYTIMGVGAARKGWLKSESILNTSPLTQVQCLLRKKLEA